MSFLDQFRKMRDSDLHDHWKSITTEAQLQSALDESFEKPVVLFKHSTTCGISAGAKFRLEQEWDFDEAELRKGTYSARIEYSLVSHAVVNSPTETGCPPPSFTSCSDSAAERYQRGIFDSHVYQRDQGLCRTVLFPTRS